MNPTETNITENRFDLPMTCDKLDQASIDSILSMKIDASKMKKTWKTIPTSENIVVFKGIVSQNYAAGEASRNSYKYDQTGWIFDSYSLNPVILWQHDQYYGAIGHAVQFWLDEEKNLNGLFYVDLDTLEPRHAKQIKNGYVSGISTWAITVEYMFEENDTGNKLTKAEAEEKYGWENVFYALYGWANDFITLIITKAQMIENSMVTIGSNEKALAVQNSIGKSFTKIAEEYKNSKSGSNQANLSSNNLTMEKPEIKKDNSPEETPTASAATDTPASEATATGSETDGGAGNGVDPATETNSVKTDDVNDVETLKNTVDSLSNQIEKMKQDHASEIAKLNSDHEKALTDAINSKREEDRKNLATVVDNQVNVPETTDEKTDVNSLEDFSEKYIQK